MIWQGIANEQNEKKEDTYRERIKSKVKSGWLNSSNCKVQLSIYTTKPDPNIFQIKIGQILSIKKK